MTANTEGKKKSVKPLQGSSFSFILMNIMVLYKRLFPAVSPSPLASRQRREQDTEEERVKGKRIFKALSGSKSFYFCNMFWLINSRKRWKEREKMSGST